MNFLVFAYVSTSVLGAISGVQFVSNLFWGKVLHNERVSMQHCIATTLLIVGVIVALAHSSKSTQNIYTPTDIVALYDCTYLWFISSLGVACVCCESIYQCIHRRDEQVRVANLPLLVNTPAEGGHNPELSQSTSDIPKRYMYSALVKPFAFAIPSTIIGTQAVIQSKCMAELLRASITARSWKCLNSAVVVAVAAAFILLVSLWLVRLQEGLARFDGLMIIPVLQCFWIITACVQGGVFFKESVELASFSLGIIILMIGVAVLASANSATEASTNPVSPEHSSIEFRAHGADVEGDEQSSIMSSGFPLASPMRPSIRPRSNASSQSSMWTLVGVDDRNPANLERL